MNGLTLSNLLNFVASSYLENLFRTFGSSEYFNERGRVGWLEQPRAVCRDPMIQLSADVPSQWRGNRQRGLAA